MGRGPNKPKPLINEAESLKQQIHSVGEIASMINAERVKLEAEVVELRAENKRLRSMQSIIHDIARSAEWVGFPLNEFQQRAISLTNK